MLFLGNCGTIAPLIRLIKHGIIPLVQIVIVVALIAFLIIDLGKAVMAGKEDEIKSAQKLAVKRVIYAIAVFLVPWLVNAMIGLLANGFSNEKTAADTAWNCWAERYYDETDAIAICGTRRMTHTDAKGIPYYICP